MEKTLSLGEALWLDCDDAYPVSGRELHERLGIGTPYTMWFKRLCEYGFVESADFQTDNRSVIRADSAVMPQDKSIIASLLAWQKKYACYNAMSKGVKCDVI